MDVSSEEFDPMKAIKGIPPKSTPQTSPEPQEPVSPFDRPDEDMSDLTNSMSALRFVPPSIRFGRGRGKAGFSQR
jgi:hypothetical protein